MPIYSISQTCNGLFVEILNKPNTAGVLVTEVLYMRFNQWTSYLGVFAQKNMSLDIRLQYSQSISQLVLQFLQIVSRNLERSKPPECVLFFHAKQELIFDSRHT